MITAPCPINDDSKFCFYLANLVLFLCVRRSLYSSRIVILCEEFSKTKGLRRKYSGDTCLEFSNNSWVQPTIKLDFVRLSFKKCLLINLCVCRVRHSFVMRICKFSACPHFHTIVIKLKPMIITRKN